MEDQRFKTIRHIETLRNYLSLCVKDILSRAEQHDQSKLQSPEREIFDEYTPRLRGVTYGSSECAGKLGGCQWIGSTRKQESFRIAR